MWKKIPDSNGLPGKWKRTKFLVDESVGKEVADWLKEIGWNARFVGDEGLNGRSDEDILAYAWRTKRMLIAFDRDFLDDKKFPFNRNPGVVVISGGSGNTESLIKSLQRTISVIGPFWDIFRGDKIIISEDEVIVRSAQGGSSKYRIKNGQAWEWEDN